MPFVKIQLIAGRTAEQKAELAKEIIDTMERLDFAKRESVKIIYEDMDTDDYYQDKDFK